MSRQGKKRPLKIVLFAYIEDMHEPQTQTVELAGYTRRRRRKNQNSEDQYRIPFPILNQQPVKVECTESSPEEMIPAPLNELDYFQSYFEKDQGKSSDNEIDFNEFFI